MRTKMKFISKVTVAHFVTYFICGVLFSKLFNYETLFKLGNAKYFWCFQSVGAICADHKRAADWLYSTDFER